MFRDPYSTHRPVLQACGTIIAPARVLELGAGWYSTATFLDPEYYPALEVLHTVEPDAEWRSLLHRLAGLAGAVAWEYIEHPTSYAGYDMIFIDSGPTDADRLQVIRRIVDAGVTCPVVLHDYENQHYRTAAKFEHVWEWRGLMPATAVLWNGDKPGLREALDGAFYTG